MDLTNLNKDRAKSRRKSSIDLSTMVYGKVPPGKRPGRSGTGCYYA